MGWHHTAMSMHPEKVAELIRTGLPGADVQVLSDDQTHFAAVVVCDAFTGKRSIARHQMVYATLGALVGDAGGSSSCELQNKSVPLPLAANNRKYPSSQILESALPLPH
jgi:acid stress-induced BolA-like protein IbaG/YrbA